MAIPQGFGQLIQDLMDAVSAVFADTPGDQIRAMAYMATASGAGPFAVRARRGAVIAMARAAQLYQPSSYDDAQAVLATVAGPMEGVITEAGDLGDDQVYVAFQELRTAVVADITDRGASLAPLATVTLPEPLPALVVAQRLYGDASRAEELVARVDPIHPLFMPVQMLVLGS